jgi:hypothetical protein
MNNNEYIIYSVKTNNFFIDNFDNFLKNNKIIYNDINELIKELENDNYYYFRIDIEKEYILFGDIDNFDYSIDFFIEKFINFLEDYYNIKINENDIFYTINNKNNNSYHYTIPSFYGSIYKIKELHQNFIKLNKKFFVKKTEKKIINVIDTTIYSNHWFRIPNQSKTLTDNSKHLIIKGEMKNFVLDYIPDYSININEYKFKNEIKKQNEIIDANTDNIEIIRVDTECEKIKDNQLILNINRENNLVLSNTMYHTNTYKEIFDNCYSQERFEIYEYWISIGMSIKNTIKDEEEAFKLFNYFSSKGRNYDGLEKTLHKFSNLITKNFNHGYTVATIYYYAICDNKSKFIEIMSKNKIELGQTDICKYIFILAGKRFLYKKIGENYKLYCYNNKYWEDDYILFRKFISGDLYYFLSELITSIYCDENFFKNNKNIKKEYKNLKNKLEKLKSISYKKELQETYKEYGLDYNIKFNENWNLFAFNNIVYDLEKSEFREHRYNDYISITCNYDWREPNSEEIKTIHNLIISIMPIEEERELFLQILSTGLDGKCLEKFIIFNGAGGNGKGVLNDLFLKAIGSYGIIANNSILFETNKTGSNPEKANLHKKRLVIMREPSEKNKFENSVMKELTGGGSFSSRTHQEKETEKELNLTLIVECNKKPVFCEEPKDSEARRIIDIYFRSCFTTDESLIDPQNFIFKANPYYKTIEFQEKHKFALLKILFDTYKKYKDNEYILKIPKSIKERTDTYLELSCFLLIWFKENYVLSENKKDFLKISDIFDNYKNTENYNYLTNKEKRQYNKKYFVDYFQTNLFLKKYYKDRYFNIRNVIMNWKLIDLKDEEYYFDS